MLANSSLDLYHAHRCVIHTSFANGLHMFQIWMSADKESAYALMINAKIKSITILFVCVNWSLR